MGSVHGKVRSGMTTVYLGRAARARTILASMVATTLVVATALATPADETTKPIVDAKKIEAMPTETETAEKARRAIEALRDLNAAFDAETSASNKAPASDVPGRPKKIVTPPTIDSAKIDTLLDKALVTSKTPVSPITTDEEFVRRIYLDVTGKLPTIDQMRAFVGSHDKTKRAKLVDHLLKSDAYASNWARYWRDVVSYRAPNENIVQTNFPAFEAWLAGELAKNKPWDEIVTAIITAEGPTDENGATSFGIAQMAQPVEMAGEVSRVFMGVQIQCAQCHDHPNDSWKREQFHEFAAFFAGTRQKLSNKSAVAKAQAQSQTKADAKTKAAPQAPRVFELISQPGTPRYTMPDLKDPQKLHPINPKFFLADAKSSGVAGLKATQRRALAASYVTGQDNPWFAKAFVNRVWGTLMGEGFTNPIDDLGPTKESHNPEVFDAIASEWQKGGYDVRWLFATILNTKAYQRESRSTNSAAGRTAFAANCASRLRSDQIFDAIGQALNLSPDSFRPGRNLPQAQRDMIAKKFAEQPKAIQQFAVMKNGPRSRFNQTFGVDPSTPHDDVLGTIPQALFLMNSPPLNNGIKATNTSMLGELLRATPDNHAVLEVLYLRVLARRPNRKEIAVCGHYLEHVGNRAEAFEDILWGLLNSTEFISRR